MVDVVATFCFMQVPDALVCPHQCTAGNLPTPDMVVVFVVTPANFALELVLALLLGTKVVEIVACDRNANRGEQHHSGGQQQAIAGQHPDGLRHGASAFAHGPLGHSQPACSTHLCQPLFDGTDRGTRDCTVRVASA